MLFEKLLVFATFSKLEYFVPALLRHLDSKAVNNHRVWRIPSLVLLFPGGGPRQGIFCALLCWLVSPENDSPAPWSISVNKVGSPLCLYRNCVQFDVPKLIATVTLIDAYTHFEVHVNIPCKKANDLCPEEFPVIRKAIEKGVCKAALNLGYYNSSPSPALLCPCGRGEAHAAEITSNFVNWKCCLKDEVLKSSKLTRFLTRWKQSRSPKYGKLTPLQCLWFDSLSGSSNQDHLAYDRNSLLIERDLPNLLTQLKKHAAKWRDIGTHLDFHPGELDNIQARPLLLITAPESWLGAMLTEWLQRAPDDPRGNSSIESLTLALSQCRIVVKLEQ